MMAEPDIIVPIDDTISEHGECFSEGRETVLDSVSNTPVSIRKYKHDYGKWCADRRLTAMLITQIFLSVATLGFSCGMLVLQGFGVVELSVESINFCFYLITLLFAIWFMRPTRVRSPVKSSDAIEE